MFKRILNFINSCESKEMEAFIVCWGIFVLCSVGSAVGIAVPLYCKILPIGMMIYNAIVISALVYVIYRMHILIDRYNRGNYGKR